MTANLCHFLVCHLCPLSLSLRQRLEKSRSPRIFDDVMYAVTSQIELVQGIPILPLKNPLFFHGSDSRGIIEDVMYAVTSQIELVQGILILKRDIPGCYVRGYLLNRTGARPSYVVSFLKTS
ncbi:hypothetical protein B0H13DRAFT_1851320 [Mycena leptocephala]|nr:hypothetical protein B0H13DRAFT_1851320 [Mycena leptocephala]